MDYTDSFGNHTNSHVGRLLKITNVDGKILKSIISSNTDTSFTVRDFTWIDHFKWAVITPIFNLFRRVKWCLQDSYYFVIDLFKVKHMEFTLLVRPVKEIPKEWPVYEYKVTKNNKTPTPKAMWCTVDFLIIYKKCNWFKGVLLKKHLIKDGDLEYAKSLWRETHSGIKWEFCIIENKD